MSKKRQYNECKYHRVNHTDFSLIFSWKENTIFFDIFFVFFVCLFVFCLFVVLCQFRAISRVLIFAHTPFARSITTNCSPFLLAKISTDKVIFTKLRPYHSGDIKMGINIHCPKQKVR